MSELKARLTKAYTINHNQWLRSDGDNRKQHDVSIDFAVTSIGVETAALRIGLEHTNHLLSVLLNDPLIPKDHKGYVQSRLDANRKLINAYEESEVSNG